MRQRACQAALTTLGPWARRRGVFGRLGTGAQKDCISPVELRLPGGPERWRVITTAAGGRHSLVLALPDNGELGWLRAWCSRLALRPGRDPAPLPPGCAGDLEQRQQEWEARKPLRSPLQASPPDSVVGPSWPAGLADDEGDEHPSPLDGDSVDGGSQTAGDYPADGVSPEPQSRGAALNAPAMPTVRSSQQLQQLELLLAESALEDGEGRMRRDPSTSPDRIGSPARLTSQAGLQQAAAVAARVHGLRDSIPGDSA